MHDLYALRDEAQVAIHRGDLGHPSVSILHCSSRYPTELAESGLSRITELKIRYPYSAIGYSDHTIGFAASIAATALGAMLIEKHITLDKTDKRSQDSQLACDEKDFPLFVQTIRDTEKAINFKYIPPPLEIFK